MSKASRGGGAEKTAMNAARALAGISVDDESWQTFLFAVFPDPQSNMDGEQMDNLMKSLHEQVGSGIRQRFSVISAQEIVQWACDNSKLYDVCKEIKSAVDGGTDPVDLSDSLLACLVKCRMLALKQNALDTKSSSAGGDEEIVSVPHTEDVPKKKDTVKEKEKESKVEKDKDRGDKSPKRGTKVSNPKSAEQGSRRQSIQPAEELPSRRKVKLRDKILTKTPDKPLSIGDEPVQGPDAYYLLQGFSSVGIFKALIEHANMTINAVINIQIGGDWSKDVSKTAKADSLTLEVVGKQENAMDTIKSYIQNADGTSLWKQVGCCDVIAISLKDGKELFDLISKKVYHVVEKKLAYNANYDHCVQITLPDVDKELLNRHGRGFYSRFLDSMGNTTPISVETIVHAMLENVSQAIGEGEGHNPNAMNYGDEKDTLSTYFDRAVEQMAFATPSSAPSDLPDQGTPVGGYNCKKSGDLTNNDVLKSMISLMPMARYQSIVSKIPWQNNEESTVRERAFFKQNLLHATGLSEYVIDLVLLQQMFGQFIEEEKGSLAPGCPEKMEGWNSVEYLGKRELTETLQTARLSLPIIRTRYLARERLLLLAMFSASSNVDSVAISRSEFQVATKPSFNLYLRLANENKAPVIPSTPLPSISVPHVYASGDEMIHQVDDCTHVYPSDGSQIQIHSVKFAHSGDDAYTKILHHDAIILWGSQGVSKYGTYLSYSLPEGNVFSMSHSDKGLVDVKVSSSNGLLLSWTTDNHVVQSYPSPAANQEHGTQGEIRRRISPEGIVFRFLRDRGIQLLYPNGNVTIIAEDGSCISTDQSGRRLGTDCAGREFSMSPIRLVKETHPGVHETSITTREDMVMITDMKEGTTIVEHVDGTKITTSADKVTVECFGFAKVEFWKEENKSVTSLSKSLTVEQSYELGVVKYKLGKLNGPLLQVSGDGNAIFAPSLCAQTQLQFGGVESRIIGAYYIDFAHNNLRLSDDGKRTFVVEQGTIKVETEDLKVDQPDSPDIQFENVELKPIWERLAKSVPPRGGSPRLFAIREDGTGVEYLHDSMVAQVLLLHANNSESEVLFETVPEEKGLMIFGITQGEVKELQSRNSRAKHEEEQSYQKIIHHYIITENVHDLVYKGLSDFAKLQLGDDFSNLQITTDGGEKTGNSRSHVLRNRLTLLISSPATTPVLEETIEIGSKLPEISTTSLSAEKEMGDTGKANLHDERNPDHTLSPKIESRPLKLKSGKKTEAYQTRKSVNPPRVKDFNAIPKYFDSLEGQEFLNTLPKGNICMKKTPSSKTKPVMVVEQPLASRPEGETASADIDAKQPQVEEKSDDVAKVEVPILSQKETPSISLNAEAVPLAQENELPKVSSKDLVQAMKIRRLKVPKPFSLRGTKPGVIPNERFIRIDGSVHRKVTTASTARMVLGNSQDFGKSVGFTTIPAFCNFGTVYAGNTYQTAFSMTNIGNDTARFKLKLLFTGSGNENALQFSYRPGPVAAGMKVKVNVRLVTSENSDQARNINEVLQVISESEILSVPIKAVVLNADDFEDSGVSIKANVLVV